MIKLQRVRFEQLGSANSFHFFYPSGADINSQTEETQETALTLACCGGFLEVADFLIKAGANLELGASTPLMEAAQEGHLELTKYLLESRASVNAQSGTGDTALTYACENGHTDVADLLLKYGAELVSVLMLNYLLKLSLTLICCLYLRNGLSQ